VRARFFETLARYDFIGLNNQDDKEGDER